jgi:class 3 adenylate cyclase
MLEEVWPEIGNAWVSGVLAGGGSILVQWLMPKAARLLGRLRAAEHPRLERRLAAILAADVVGYSRLMSADEEGTHRRLLAYRREVIEPKVRQHRGRIVKHTGDGALVEFRSVVGAVRCALEVQKLLAARNAKIPQNRRIEFRIGVNLGDVIVAPEDIYGHGVNVAARLESLAPAGGICISADAWRHVRGAVAAEFVDLGEHRLKNIADPAHVFAVAPAG